MNEVIITQGITVSALVAELAETVRSHAQTPEALQAVLSEAVPLLTKTQAARMLGCSKKYIDDLVASGYLQEAQGRGVEKYQMQQVFSCLLQGRTGKKLPLSLEKIIAK
jgi:hypothetical protein